MNTSLDKRKQRLLRMTSKELEEPTKEELEAAEKVIETDPERRGEETLKEAFINRIEETIEVGDIGYTREVVLPIPLELINDDENTKKFVKQVGQISRDETYHLPVSMERENIQDVETMNLVFKPTEETNIEAIKQKLG